MTDEALISPLAKRLAEDNSIDWRRIKGTGTGGRIIERDILLYLSRVMTGEVELPPEPDRSEQAPAGAANVDIAAAGEKLAREGVDVASILGPANPDVALSREEAQPLVVDDTLDSDLVLEDDAVTADVSSSADGEAVFEFEMEDAPPAASDAFPATFGQGAPSQEPEVEDAGPPSVDPRATGESDFAQPFAAGGPSSGEVPGTDIIEAMPAAEEMPEEPVPPMDWSGLAASRSPVLDSDDEPDFRYQPEFRAEPTPEPASEQPEETDRAAWPEQPPAAPLEVEEPTAAFQPAAPVAPALAASVPTAATLRRSFDAAAILDAQLHVSDALEGLEVPLALFLARAASRALETMPSLRSLALATVGDEGLTPLATPRLNDSFREAAADLSRAADAEEDADLIVVDGSELGVDEIVVPVSGVLLSLGQLRDGPEAEVTATLTLSGSFPLRSGARFLNHVAELLESPIGLVV